MTNKTEAELATEYNDTHDLSEFDEGDTVPVQVRREVTISVRFSDDEIAELRRRADARGVKVTALIRDAALANANPLDLAAVRRAAATMAKTARELDGLTAPGKLVRR